MLLLHHEVIFNQNVSKIPSVFIDDVSEKTDQLVSIKRDSNMRNEKLTFDS